MFLTSDCFSTNCTLYLHQLPPEVPAEEALWPATVTQPQWQRAHQVKSCCPPQWLCWGIRLIASVWRGRTSQSCILGSVQCTKEGSFSAQRLSELVHHWWFRHGNRSLKESVLEQLSLTRFFLNKSLVSEICLWTTHEKDYPNSKIPHP